jgi:hypothetical protein
MEPDYYREGAATSVATGGALDNALPHPWTVDKRCVHASTPHPDWREASCVEGSELLAIGKEMYIIRADGLLMPAKKAGQKGPAAAGSAIFQARNEMKPTVGVTLRPFSLE